MHRRIWLVVSGFMILILAAGWILVTRQESNKPRRGDSQNPGRSSPATRPNYKPATGTKPVPSTGPAIGNQATPQAESQRILGILHEAAVSYDAAELPKIDPYLLHPDPEIRKAAMESMVTLGDASAGPLLRKASEQAPSPREAQALLDAADYVELPSAKLELKKRTQPVKSPAWRHAKNSKQSRNQKPAPSPQPTQQ